MLVRPAQPTDTPAMLALMEESLGKGKVPRTEEFFRWKHRNSPFGPSPALVAIDGERIASMRTMMRWNFANPWTTVTAVRAVDTATHPDYQGRGLFRALTLRLVEELTTEGVAFVFNTPNQVSGAGYLKMGWRRVGSATVLLQPRPWAFSGRILARPWQVSDLEAAELQQAIRSGVVETLEPSGAVRLSTPRNSAYAAWRYRDVPGIRYAAICEPGYFMMVYRKRYRRGLRELTLCETMVGGRPGSVGRMRAALKWLSADAEVTTCSGNWSDRLTAVFVASGFVPVVGPELYARGLARPPVSSIRDLRVSIGDLELF